MKYGRLEVISVEGRVSVCRCDCGTIIKRPTAYLKSGDTKSCGCLKRDVNRQRNILRSTHNESKSLMYRLWANIKARCNCETHKDYARYGGRGIKVDPAWEFSYETFKHDMSPRTGHSIDRIDNSKGYSKENCRWASPVDQAHNRRNNIQLELDGEVKCLAEWARCIGVKECTLYKRITKYGWSVDRALRTGAIR